MATLFLNGTVIDGNGGLTERGGVLVQGGKVAAVGPSVALEPRRRDTDTIMMDLAGRALMPGLMDTHAHLAAGDFVPHREGERTLMAGITTIRAAGSRGFLDVDLGDAIDQGVIVGPGCSPVAAGSPPPAGTTTTGAPWTWTV